MESIQCTSISIDASYAHRRYRVCIASIIRESRQKANFVSRQADHRRNRRQNFFQIGDAAIAEGVPASRRGAFAAYEPDDGGALNEMFAEVHSGQFAKRCAAAKLPWMLSAGSLCATTASQRSYIELAAAGLRWLMAHGRDFTSATQEDVFRMGGR